MNKESLKIGLKIHEGKKTDFMTDIDIADNMQTDRVEIKKMNNYTYLGQRIAMGCRTRQEVSEKNKSRMECLGKVQRNRS